LFHLAASLATRFPDAAIASRRGAYKWNVAWLLMSVDVTSQVVERLKFAAMLLLGKRFDLRADISGRRTAKKRASKRRGKMNKKRVARLL
jgi:hypothetical protein